MNQIEDEYKKIPWRQWKLSPTGPEHVLSSTLCGAVAAAVLTQIRKHAATEEGKALLKTLTVITGEKVDTASYSHCVYIFSTGPICRRFRKVQGASEWGAEKTPDWVLLQEQCWCFPAGDARVPAAGPQKAQGTWYLQTKLGVKIWIY